MANYVRLFLLAAILLGILSCSRDARPYDVRVKEVLGKGLSEYGVKGASAAVIMPDGSIRSFASDSGGR